jgi:hypothetical protein
VVLTAPLILLLAVSVAAQLQSDLELEAGREIVWLLKDPRVVDPGQTVTSPQGVMTQGYTVEATAYAPGTMTSEGVFRITLSAFYPREDMPGQKAGKWYILGKWTIMSTEEAAKGSQTRRSGGIRGELNGELAFNPATTPGEVKASIRVPYSRMRGSWAAGKGTFVGNEKFGGQLTLTPDRVQRKRLPKGGQ